MKSKNKFKNLNICAVICHFYVISTTSLDTIKLENPEHNDIMLCHQLIQLIIVDQLIYRYCVPAMYKHCYRHLRGSLWDHMSRIIKSS